VAERAGCALVKEAVTAVTKEEGGFRLLLAGGGELRAKKVVLATGAHTAVSGLLKDLTGRRPALDLATQTVAFLAVPPGEAARLADLPALSTLFPWGALDGTYILPPLRHPDGNHYIKLGHHTNFEGSVSSMAELEAWYGPLHSRLSR
jgi:sarcosine oxidase